MGKRERKGAYEDTSRHKWVSAKVGTVPKMIQVTASVYGKMKAGRYKVGDRIAFRVWDRGQKMVGRITGLDPVIFLSLV